MLLWGSAAPRGLSGYRNSSEVKILSELSERLARGEFSCEFLGEFIGEDGLISAGGITGIGGITGTIGGTGATNATAGALFGGRVTPRRICEG